MARMPGADWVGPHHDNGVMSRFDILCFHTIVGYAPAHAAHFSTRADGWVYQSRDTTYRSAANLNGNYRVIAVETEDHGPAFGAWSGSDVPAWTPAQIEAHAKIAAWAHATHGIPLVAAPDSRPTSRGIAFHRQGIDGNFPNGRVAGGELWSSSAGKVCPGDRRIAQVPQIIHRARQLAGLAPMEDELPTPNDVMMAEVYGTDPETKITEHHPFAEWFTALCYRARTTLRLAAEAAGKDPNTVDVDEGAIAAELAPMIVALLPDQTSRMSEDDLARIAKAVNDELARRQAA